MPLTNVTVRVWPFAVTVQVSPTLCASIGVQSGLVTPGGGRFVGAAQIGAIDFPRTFEFHAESRNLGEERMVRIVVGARVGHAAGGNRRVAVIARHDVIPGKGSGCAQGGKRSSC